MNYDRIILEMLDRIKCLEEEIEDIKRYHISNSIGNNKSEEPKVKLTYEQLTGKDNTKYIFKGMICGKNKLVLNVVKEYVKINPNITVAELQEVFDYSLQGSRNYGVVKRIEEAKLVSDYEKRFFVDDEIMVSDGIVVVCTQWAISNINRFIVRAEQLGFDIKKI